MFAPLWHNFPFLKDAEAPVDTMDQLTPVWEIVFGTLPLLVTLFIHGIGMYAVQSRFERHVKREPRTRLRNELFFGAMILLMLATHLVEIIVWTATLLFVDAVRLVARCLLLCGGHVHDAGLRRGHAATRVAVVGADDRDFGTVRVRLDDGRPRQPRFAGVSGADEARQRAKRR